MTGRPGEVEAVVPVRTYDIDFSGTVGNVAVVRWLEDLRIALSEAHMPLGEALSAGIVPVVAATSVEYLRPVRIGDSVRGRAWVSRVGAARFTVEFEIDACDLLAVRAKQEMCFVTVLTGRVARAPAAVRKIFQG